MRVMAGLGHGEGGSKEGREKRNWENKEGPREGQGLCVQVRRGLERQERPFLRLSEHTSFKALLPRPVPGGVREAVLQWFGNFLSKESF